MTPSGIARYHLVMAMTLRLSDADAAALRNVAEEEGRSMQEVVVSALREYLAKRDDFRTRQVDRFLSEDAELLRLLAQ